MHKILQYEWVLSHFSLLLVAQVKIIRWCWLALDARGSSGTARTARSVVSDTRKFDRGLTRILHDDLHWLDVADRVTYKLGVIMHRCRHGKAPQYLVDCCTPVTDVVGRQRLRSATQQPMVVPRHRLSTVGRRAFSVHGPVVWNSLPDDLRAQQDYESFRQGPKTWLFSRY